MECAQILGFYPSSSPCYTHHSTYREYLNIPDLELWPTLPMPAVLRELPPANKNILPKGWVN